MSEIRSPVPKKTKFYGRKVMREFVRAGAREEIIYINSPGTLSFDYSSVPYTKLDRPMWPIVEDPFN